MSQLSESFTVQLTPKMRASLNQRAACEERTAGQVIRRALAAYLDTENESDEVPADVTPELPLS